MRALFIFYLCSWVVFSSIAQEKTEDQEILKLDSISRNFWRSNPDSARFYARELLDLSKTKNNLLGKTKAYNNLAATYFFVSNYDSAEYFWKAGLEIALEADMGISAANFYGNLALIYEYKQQFVEALEYNFKALALKQEFGEFKDWAVSYNNIGNIYLALDDYEKALYYHRKALEIRKEHDQQRISSTYSNLGNSFLGLKIYDSALFYLKKSNRLKSDINDLWGLAVNYENLGQLHYSNGRVNRATHYFEKMDSLAESIDAKALQIRAKLELAQIAYQTKNYDKSATLIEKIRSQLMPVELYQEVALLKLLGDIYYTKNNLSTAAKFYHEYNVKKDSLESIQNADLIAEVKAKTFYEQRTEELKSEQAIKERILRSEIENAEKIRLILTIGIVVVIFILLVLLYALLILRKKNTELKVQSEKIADLISEKEDIIRMRTEELLSSKSVIVRYAFLNSHELRGPLARMMGIIHLASEKAITEKEFIEKLKESADEVDRAVRKISDELDSPSHYS